MSHILIFPLLAGRDVQNTRSDDLSALKNLRWREHMSEIGQTVMGKRKGFLDCEKCPGILKQKFAKNCPRHIGMEFSANIVLGC
jgi:hypothetical protein